MRFNMSYKRAAYEIQKKKIVVEWIRDHAEGVPTRAATVFKLPPATARAWWKCRDEILNARSQDLSRKRVRGSTAKKKNKQCLEIKLDEYTFKEVPYKELKEEYNYEDHSKNSVHFNNVNNGSKKSTKLTEYTDQHFGSLHKENSVILGRHSHCLDKYITQQSVNVCINERDDEKRTSITYADSCENAEAYGKVWISDFCKLSETQKIFAKRAIDEILYHGKFNNLCHQSSIIRTKGNLDLM